MINWLTIKNDYINGGGSYRELAKKYGVSLSAVQRRAQRENWLDQKRANIGEIDVETVEKTIEKASDVMSEFNTLAMQIKLRVLQMGEKWLDNNETITSTEDFYRMVRCFKEMGVFDREVVSANDDGVTDDPLTRSLKEEAERLNSIYIEIGQKIKNNTY